MTGFIESSGDLHVGRMSRENGNFYAGASPDAPITIGSFCAIARNVSLISANHDVNYAAVQGAFYYHYFSKPHPGETPPFTRERSKGPIIIGNDVWIGEGVTILSGVTVGDGCCIGANSVVTRSMPAYSIAAGNPCRFIRQRYSADIVRFLLDLKWWDWDDDVIRRNERFFEANLNEICVEELAGLVIP
ncbi:hypothetical protein C0214_13540 [Methylobacterium sp. DM1]|nr:hypothetical protein C0214_13540 [Methylobacterium sp. DM1]